MSSNVAAAIIGAAAALAVVAVSGLVQRWLDARRQRSELVAAAITDVFAAVTTSSLNGNQQEALETYAHAKARLATFGSRKVVDALLAFQRAGDTTATAEGQAAFAKLVLCARVGLLSKQKPLPITDVQAVLYGPGQAQQDQNG